MDYYYKDDDDDDDGDEHDEDDLPEVSLPMSNHTRQLTNNHDDPYSNRSVENWRSLYQTSVHSLQSDEDDQRSTPQKPFYLERQPSIEQSPSIEHPPSIEKPPSIEQPPDERFGSPLSEPEINSNTNKSKWEIRLPELLNCMVGPDRQKREASRRHTTNIVFQQSPESPPYSLGNDANPPLTPLVKQLRQKFDRMTTNTNDNTNGPATPDTNKSRFHIPKYQRFASLTGRALTGAAGERPALRSRPALPVRSTTEIVPAKARSGSITSINSRTTITNNRNQRDKAGPPVSYPKHYYPPPSTTSVVRQLIGGGGTLVYDSITQKSAVKSKPLIKHQRSLEQTREDLKNTNSALTGRQLPPDQTKTKKNNHQSNDNYYEPVRDDVSQHSTRSRSIDSSSHHRQNSNSSEREPSNLDSDRDTRK